MHILEVFVHGRQWRTGKLLCMLQSIRLAESDMTGATVQQQHVFVMREMRSFVVHRESQKENHNVYLWCSGSRPCLLLQRTINHSKTTAGSWAMIETAYDHETSSSHLASAAHHNLPRDPLDGKGGSHGTWPDLLLSHSPSSEAISLIEQWNSLLTYVSEAPFSR